VASNRPRLLLDESVTEPLASYIVRLVPSAKLSKAILGQGAKDPAVAALANNDKRTIVAVDSDFKKHTVTWGVIKINHPERADDDCLFAIFRAFWQSGKRADARKRRTSLTNDGFRIKNGETTEHKWQTRPCPHRTPGGPH
jgi:hypothetical protein